MFYPLMVDVAESPDCEFYLGEQCLYDSVHLAILSTTSNNPRVISGVHAIGQAYIPVQDYFLVRIKPTRPMALIDTEQSCDAKICRFKKRREKSELAEWLGGSKVSRFREFSIGG